MYLRQTCLVVFLIYKYYINYIIDSCFLFHWWRTITQNSHVKKGISDWNQRVVNIPSSILHHSWEWTWYSGLPNHQKTWVLPNVLNTSCHILQHWVWVFLLYFLSRVQTIRMYTFYWRGSDWRGFPKISRDARGVLEPYSCFRPMLALFMTFDTVSM